jgi:hypothetical protein
MGRFIVPELSQGQRKQSWRLANQAAENGTKARDALFVQFGKKSYFARLGSYDCGAVGALNQLIVGSNTCRAGT